METTELIQIVKETLAKDFVNWMPLMKRVDKDPVDIDAPCKEEGCTLLQWALENDANQAASIAITLGASVNAKGFGKFDCTPLDIAARRGNETCCSSSSPITTPPARGHRRTLTSLVLSPTRYAPMAVCRSSITASDSRDQAESCA